MSRLGAARAVRRDALAAPVHDLLDGAGNRVLLALQAGIGRAHLAALLAGDQLVLGLKVAQVRLVDEEVLLAGPDAALDLDLRGLLFRVARVAVVAVRRKRLALRLEVGEVLGRDLHLALAALARLRRDAHVVRLDAALGVEAEGLEAGLRLGVVRTVERRAVLDVGLEGEDVLAARALAHKARLALGALDEAVGAVLRLALGVVDDEDGLAAVSRAAPLGAGRQVTLHVLRKGRVLLGLVVERSKVVAVAVRDRGNDA